MSSVKKNMDKIKEIYQNLMQETEEMKHHRKIVEQKIESVMEESGNKISKEEYETFRDRFYEVAMVAEENGFILGFRYAVKLIMECNVEKSLQNLDDF